MKYCKKCVMPDTRPGIIFDEEGICSACRSFERRNTIDWKERWKEFEALCSRYRGMNGTGNYDCAVAVSGGKDSHYQVYIMKEKMKMNPILFSVEDNFTMTEAGKANIKNLSDEFGCNIISLKPDIRTQRILMRKTFEKHGKPTWFIDRLIYTYPLMMALKFNTPLLVYGENVSYEYGGSDAKETYSAKEILRNGVASDIPIEDLLGTYSSKDEFANKSDSKYTLSEKDLILTKAPTVEELDKLDPIYLSYFIPWDGTKNYEFSKTRGFQDLEHEWNRTHHVENFNQIDSYGYLFNGWMKYPKFGHAHGTDHAARFVRDGQWTREMAIERLKDVESNPDRKMIDDYIKFCGYSYKEFYEIMDRWYNSDLFEKDSYGRWVLKNPIWKEEKES